MYNGNEFIQILDSWISRDIFFLNFSVDDISAKLEKKKTGRIIRKHQNSSYIFSTANRY
jgi:hypothetical protein